MTSNSNNNHVLNLDGLATFASGGMPNLSVLLNSNLFNKDSFKTTNVTSSGNAHTISSASTPSAPLTQSTSSGSGSGSGSFLLGMHSYSSLEGIDLPAFVKEHNGTLTFPEKLMLMLTYVEKIAKDNGQHPSMSWTPDGRVFVIHNKEALVSNVLPLFFKQGKFASFTRKLYRWGFRQVSISLERSQRKEMIFGHEYFQRDNKELMVKMRSVTAAGRRRAAKKNHEESKGFTDLFENEEVPDLSQIQQLQPDPITDPMFGGDRIASNETDQSSGLVTQPNKRLKLSSSASAGAPASARFLPLSSLSGNGPVLQGFTELNSSSTNQQLTNNYLSMLTQQGNLTGVSQNTTLQNNGIQNNSLQNNGIQNNELLIQQAQQSLMQHQSMQAQQSIQTQAQQTLQSAIQQQAQQSLQNSQLQQALLRQLQQQNN
mmetsp:Transcript_18180/g.25622  ORF Transcript_18180/g.25622 Transcript_18180/m.25622 type:complete len:429 (-) Transcript_18180:1399-2685(-)